MPQDLSSSAGGDDSVEWREIPGMPKPVETVAVAVPEAAVEQVAAAGNGCGQAQRQPQTSSLVVSAGEGGAGLSKAGATALPISDVTLDVSSKEAPVKNQMTTKKGVSLVSEEGETRGTNIVAHEKLGKSARKGSIVCNNATTGHKLQGATVKNIFVHALSSRRNWLYVVLSRVTTMKGLFLREKIKAENLPKCNHQPEAMVSMVKGFKEKHFQGPLSDEECSEILGDAVADLSHQQ